jgi:DNA-directed RNA polymerase subunit beta
MKEQEVFFGDIPLMSANGTFIVNGTERVIVSQLHRSPGVFFETANNRTYFLGKIIPYRGSWVEFEYDQKNTLYVRIDRTRKFLGTIFLRALGLRTDEEILKTFYTVDTITVKDGKLTWAVTDEATPTHLVGTRTAAALHNAKKEEIVAAGKKIGISAIKHIRAAGITSIEVETSEFDGAMIASDVIHRRAHVRGQRRAHRRQAPQDHAVRCHHSPGLLPGARRRRQHHCQHPSPRLRPQA